MLNKREAGGRKLMERGGRDSMEAWISWIIYRIPGGDEIIVEKRVNDKKLFPSPFGEGQGEGWYGSMGAWTIR